MKQITRTVSEFTINACEIKFVNGKVETTDLAPITLKDETSCDDKKAMKEVVKVYGKGKQYGVKSVTRVDEVYAVDFDVFMKHAKKIERPASQQKTDEPAPVNTPEVK